MNKSEEFKEDILKRYINPGKIEKAPEGFTGRVMTRIEMEKKPATVSVHILIRYRIPLFSIGIIAVLILSAMFVTYGGDDQAISSALKPYYDLLTDFPKFNLDKITGISIPVSAVYIMLGIFLLSVLDRFLNLIFRRPATGSR